MSCERRRGSEVLQYTLRRLVPLFALPPSVWGVRTLRLMRATMNQAISFAFESYRPRTVDS